MSSVHDNMGLIHSIARKVWGRLAPFARDIEYEDLVQEGIRAYVRAENNFKEGKGAKLSTYASNAIMNRLNFVADTAINSARQELRIEGDFFDMVEDATEFNVENEEILRASMAQLSKLGALILRESVAPSDKMLEHFRQCESNAREEGRSVSGYFHMNAVADYIRKAGIEEALIVKAIKQVKQLGRSNEI